MIKNNSFVKILHINTSINKGGAARIASMLHLGLNNSHWYKSYFAYGRDKTVDNDNIFYFSYLPEVYLSVFIARATGYEGFGNYFSTKKLINYIRNNEFDIIHLHNIHGYYINLPLLIGYLKSTKIPVVWTLHDCWPITGSCAYFFSCNKYLTGCGRCPHKKNYPKNYVDASASMWVLKKRLFTADWNPTIVSPSLWLTSILKKSFLRRYHIITIANGIDVNKFLNISKTEAKLKLGLPKSCKIILYVAVDIQDERKGASYFIDALGKLKNVDSLIVIIVGQKYKGKLGKKIKILQYGYISDIKCLQNIYCAADVFCITSLDDNFPTTVLEAMACGTPVVGFDVGGIPEQISKGCGIVVPPKDTNELAKAIDSILENDVERNNLGTNCRKTFVERYSSKAFLNSYMKLYSGIVKN